MKRFIKRLLKALGLLIALPLIYLLAAVVAGLIPVNETQPTAQATQTVYLSTNGVHLDIIFAKDDAGPELLKDLKFEPSAQYLAFGWGDKDFYLNTPGWDDLELGVAINAMFLKSETLIHVSPYASKRDSWTKVSISQEQLDGLTKYLLASFRKVNDHKIHLTNYSYGYHDSFYEANGSYSCFKTCNTWANMAFKENGLKACLWTPFDFGLLNMYGDENN